MDVGILQKNIPIDDPHVAPLGLVCAEDTANKGGGTVYPLDVLDEMATIAHRSEAYAHLDKTRLFNAQVASGISVARRRAQNYDTVSICFSKGLGAPVGSALCIPKSFAKICHQAQLFGGRDATIWNVGGCMYMHPGQSYRRSSSRSENAATLAQGLGKDWVFLFRNHPVTWCTWNTLSHLCISLI